jgi:hypothetical protein
VPRSRGNLLEPSIDPRPPPTEQLEISGADGVVESDRFDPTQDPAIVETGSVTIGASATNAGNLIENTATEKPGPEDLPGVDGSITIAGGESKVENKTPTDNGGWGAV